MADREWTADCVADHFEEAFRTLRKLPPVKAQGYFNTWPDIVRTSREIAAMEPQPMRVWPSAAAITRLEQTFDWVLWIEEAERKLGPVDGLVNNAAIGQDSLHVHTSPERIARER